MKKLVRVAVVAAVVVVALQASLALAAPVMTLDHPGVWTAPVGYIVVGGTLADDDTPVAGASVSVANTEPGSWSAGGTTDANGHFSAKTWVTQPATITVSPAMGSSASFSAVSLVVTPRARFDFISASSRVRKNRKVAVLATLMTVTTSGRVTVTLVGQHREHGLWKRRLTKKLTVTVASLSATGEALGNRLVTFNTKLTSKGSWRFRIDVPKGANVLGASSAWKSTKVTG